MSPEPTYYFAYGSNLWLAQMHRRCPGHTLVGPALLANHRWQINTRGYANLVPSPSHNTYGVVYTIASSDEAQLDRSEGVPKWYQRRRVTVRLLDPNPNPNPNPNPDELENVLVYIDTIRTVDGVCREEYVARINNGFRDAVGIPEEWVRRYVRGYVPPGVEGMVEDPFLFKSLGEVQRAIEEEVGAGVGVGVAAKA